MKKIFITLFMVLCIMTVAFSQQTMVDDNMASKGISKTGNPTKDLNAAEKNNIESIRLKQSNSVNPDYVFKKIDTSNLEIFSTKPIVKGSIAKPKVAPVIVKEKVSPQLDTFKLKKIEQVVPENIGDNSKPVKLQSSSKDTLKGKVISVSSKPKAEAPKIQQQLVVDTSKISILPKKTVAKDSSGTVKKEKKNKQDTILKQIKILEEKKPVMSDNFSTQPIVKDAKSNNDKDGNTIPVKAPVAVLKYSVDTTKALKEFTFETAPVFNKNASYSRRDEPLPKTKEQIEDAIPVNRKPNNVSNGRDNSFVKEAYAQYDKEADSLHAVNKRRLDSIMQALNIKVPVVISPTDFIDIYLSGGGALTDGNAKQYDRISILHTGIVQREYKTKNDGIQRTEKKISKDELTKLAQYMVDMGFLDFNSEYDCADEDAVCNQRFSKQPQPVPLEVSLTAGQRKNKVKVAIYAPKTEKNLVNYPSNLEKIMNAIYTIVEK